ncbi:MAG: TIM barrel protein [Acidimicrobiales bacterium]
MTSYRIAGAPISWGVCEVPGWGYQLRPSRVLTEMHEVGLTATELGPTGFLPADPVAAAGALAAHRLGAIGGFTPVVMHVPAHDPLGEIGHVLDGYAATGSTVLALAAVSGSEGYDRRPVLGDEGWRVLLGNLDRISALAGERGVRAVLHPHVGTMVESGEDVQRALEGCSVPLCLDTGHLLIGGSDPAELARRSPGRIAHVHLKDVDAPMAARVRSGALDYAEAVRKGMYRPLGSGDVDIAGIVDQLESSGYEGWYVLEQDTALVGEPFGEGPVTDVRASFEFIRKVLGKWPSGPARPALRQE